MATTKAAVGLPLPVLPDGWSAEKSFKIIGSLSEPVQRVIEPVGPHFLAYARRKRYKRTFSEDERIQAQENVKKVEDDESGEISEAEDPVMLSRDAKDWKSQDHYAVLGLSRHRYRATEEQIKRAHRKKVLKHHPDKKAAAGIQDDDSFFKCIQKATEILLDPTKRRQFDSVDEAADVDAPSKKTSQSGNFFKLWNPVFDSEGRFSTIVPVPKLGDEDSTKAQVEHFYNFWYNFDSWRSFEYLDEDVPDDNESRDQKRHVERKNQNARKKRKTEDTARLRKLVDTALELDERIKKFRKEEHAQKNKKRLDREAQAKQAAELAERQKTEAAQAAAEKEVADKAARADVKKAKEAAKNAVKKNKRLIRAAVKDANHFEPLGQQPSLAKIDAALLQTDVLIAALDADGIADLTAKLSGIQDPSAIKGVFASAVKQLAERGKLQESNVPSIV